MILVILGAGASYDSVPSRPPDVYSREQSRHRPPLANELFLNSELVDQVLQAYPQCHAVIPYLQDLPPDRSVEQALEILKLEAESDPERVRQLAAIKYYLRKLIWEYEDRWGKDVGHITNHKALLDQLRRSREEGDTVGFVTFNYDRMIEKALSSTLAINIKTFSDYIGHDDFKLFKLHGSIDWYREVATAMDEEFFIDRGVDHCCPVN